MDFVLKDNPIEAKVKIRECLLNALERYTCQANKIQKTYTIEVGDRKISVDYNDTFFFETSDNIHKIILHAKERRNLFDFYSNDETIVGCCSKYFLHNKNCLSSKRKGGILFIGSGKVEPVFDCFLLQETKIAKPQPWQAIAQ